MTQSDALTALAFLGAGSLVLLVYWLLGARNRHIEARLQELSGQTAATFSPHTVAQFTQSTLPKIGTPLIPSDEEERTRLKARLVHAGFYSRQAMVIYLGAKMLLIVSPPIIGLFAGLSGLLPVLHGAVLGLLASVVGVIGPSFWLDYRKAKRQNTLRRALPDALDVMVICLEGGLSLPGAFKRVAGELGTAHTMLATEMNIVQREMQLGLSTGEALRKFGKRCDLEELRTLASVVIQAERFGASMVKALRIHAESLRHKRLEHAEEMAQKAATKMLFPTIFCIFPAMFLVILGPAAFQIMDMFAYLRR